MVEIETLVDLVGQNRELKARIEELKRESESVIRTHQRELERETDRAYEDGREDEYEQSGIEILMNVLEERFGRVVVDEIKLAVKCRK